MLAGIGKWLQATGRWLRAAGTLSMLTLCLAAPPAAAAEGEALLRADEVVHDEAAAVITARGNVEVAYGERVLVADEIAYDLGRDVIVATGNVALVDPAGDVIFAERAEVTSDLDEAFVNQVRALLHEGSRMTAANAVRTDGNLTVFNRASFTPCRECATGTDQRPLWHIEADRVEHDQAAQTLRYRNARLNMLGVPIAFTPYFEHPDWTVDRKSGLLSPRFGRNSFQGLYAEQPYFHVIDETSDVLLTPRVTQRRLPVLQLRHRQLLPYGEMRTELSGTHSRRIDHDDQRRTGTFRGHVEAFGRFSLDRDWRAGYDLRRASDQSYLRAYDFRSDARYDSRIFAERFEGRSYFGANAFAYQTLTSEISEKRQPIVLPMLELSQVGEPRWQGAYPTLDANLLSILRRSGREVRRLSVTPGLTLPAIGRFGEVYRLRAAVQMDGYWTHGHRPGSANPDPLGADGNRTTGRIFPHAALEVRYPWLVQGGGVQQTVEPIFQFVAAPPGGNHRKIPNEDSLDLEFDDTNLFAINRYPGIDRIDSGSRIDYGLNYAIATGGSFYSEAFLGQSYRLRRNRSFPTASGLRHRRSDYVARLRLRPIEEIDLVYRARLDRRSLRPIQQEAEARLGPDRINLELGYLDLPDLSAEQLFGRRQEVTGQINAQISDSWRLAAFATRDIEEGYTPRMGIAVAFDCECFSFSARAQRKRYRDRELRPDYSFTFNVTFRYLGGIGAN